MSQIFPELWVHNTLGAQLIRSDERIDPLTKPNKTFFYIGLENIESNTGRLLNVPLVQGRDIKSIKSIFRKGDILYGKLRPNLNKVIVADRDGIASTDIWVLRARPTVEPRYVANFLRSPQIVQRMSQIAVGANLPRVDADAFDSISIPLPPFSEQLRIVDLLNEVAELLRLRRDAEGKAAQLLSSLFNDMFGEPKADWPERKSSASSESFTLGYSYLSRF
jgi:restriction endonuclease S subunit